MNPLRVLITNNTLDSRAGTELYVYDVAVALLERGHRPVAYSNVLGQVATELEAAGVPIIGHLDSLSIAPDVIHGHHHLEVMTALTHFPGVPAILFCHSSRHWEEMPIHFPRIRRYLAMNQGTYNRLTCEHGVSQDRVEWMSNFVDLTRFRPRSPLPPSPKRAVVFSNYAKEEGYLRVIRAACERAELELDVIGLGVGNPSSRPWEVLGEYDLVFASGRSALESLASGTAVIICNTFGLGPMVTAAEVDRLRTLNFGSMSTVGAPFNVDEVLTRISRYSAEDATEASSRVRSVAGLDATIDRLLSLYTDVIDEQRQAPPAADEEMRAVSTYLRQVSDRVKAAGALRHQADVALAETLQSRYDYGVLRHENVAIKAEQEAVRAEMSAMRDTTTWRIAARLHRMKLLMRIHRLARRRRT